MRILFILVLLAAVFFTDSFAQSGRNAPQVPPSSTAENNSTNDLTVEKMFTEADGYAKKKFTEYEQKKIPFAENIYYFVLREQKQLAAKYAALAKTQQNLSGEDFYYLGMLHWLAENSDGAAENLRNFLALDKHDPLKLQTTRSVVAVIAARQKNFDEAERLLADYLKNEPVKLSEHARMETELSLAYKKREGFRARCAAR